LGNIICLSSFKPTFLRYPAYDDIITDRITETYIFRSEKGKLNVLSVRTSRKAMLFVV